MHIYIYVSFLQIKLVRAGAVCTCFSSWNRLQQVCSFHYGKFKEILLRQVKQSAEMEDMPGSPKDIEKHDSGSFDFGLLWTSAFLSCWWTKCQFEFIHQMLPRATKPWRILGWRSINMYLGYSLVTSITCQLLNQGGHIWAPYITISPPSSCLSHADEGTSARLVEACWLKSLSTGRNMWSCKQSKTVCTGDISSK